ncbi:bidirectional sugar transporter SWEET7b-like [Spinacia oleracea]|uniref:Bidirectional sugar transporter SWEET n=1 Tax=Spinacia oleracea TaxID=3562 RepID=A0A9R0IJQ4_SPIOL|nr:bidirectional sugar transporter SWEET7b-like [Spinacia oleracea]XP_056683923.1 bidirectional sugar transporter SWEET7b-like [Spinacia oleracea]
MVSPNQVRNALGIIGNVISFGLFLSPSPTFYRIIKNKSVEEFKPWPYVVTVLNCLFWMLYGLPVTHPNNILVTTINGIGLGIELIYVAIFLFYSSGTKRQKVLGTLIVEVIIFAVVLVLTLKVFHTTDARTIFVGVFCVIFNCFMYFSPLLAMTQVVKSKSVEYMPFLLTLTGFLNGLCWTSYALIHIDWWMVVPNGLGTLSGIMQLVLYGIYYKRKSNTSNEVELPTKMATEV